MTRSSTRNEEMYSMFRRKSPSPDPNELMLVWPLDSRTGAVHITHGDFKRLEPQEFLNDTLIEFGLSEAHPEMARDVHMFNTFFYKKISNKDFDAGYESVRKWTSKVDIFAKKYIIVPINEHLHWYLAIICNPQGILRPPPVKELLVPRKSSRLSTGRQAVAPLEVSTPISEVSSGPADEAEVETLATPLRTQVEDVHMEDAVIHISESGGSGDTAPVADLHAADMDVDSPPTSLLDPTREISLELGDGPPPRHAVTQLSPSPSRGRLSEASSPLEPVHGEDDETLIFTFDSLGGAHKPVTKILSRYLQAEAKDKKGIVETREGVGKKARAPTQHNFCDCGLFVIHFVEKFMDKPEQFIQSFLMDQKKGEKKPGAYWDELWHKEEVNEKRDLLKGEINSLAEQWKKKRSQAQGEDRKGKEKEASIIPSGEETAPGSKSDEESDGVEIVGEKKKTASPRAARRKKGDRRSSKAGPDDTPDTSQEIEEVKPRRKDATGPTRGLAAADVVKMRPRRSINGNPFLRV
ncbi:cysteine proteinase [Calocera cornea HHB12733]|uniref:Cysteine proteinase n=1 Tax=Calocera cornea HHB12733 TaxID=1353952 RepID=A0A165CUK6_9BASI|nr:cysteine proteinase [Calocera cornea HHB12733]